MMCLIILIWSIWRSVSAVVSLSSFQWCLSNTLLIFLRKLLMGIIWDFERKCVPTLGSDSGLWCLSSYPWRILKTKLKFIHFSKYLKLKQLCAFFTSLGFYFHLDFGPLFLTLLPIFRCFLENVFLILSSILSYSL